MKSIPAPQPGRALTVSERAYHMLLAAYPADFHQRFGAEMAQVFRASCRAAYRARGPAGVARLWLPALWDWAWSAARERFASFSRRFKMSDTLSYDKQMGDLVWSLMTGLHAAYSLPQVIEAISLEAPEPTASAFKRLHADLTSGLSLEQGLANLHKAVPSQYLDQVIAVIQEQTRTGGNLGDLLAPLVDEILEQVPSDGTFFPAMRREAENLGAPLPERAKL